MEQRGDVQPQSKNIRLKIVVPYIRSTEPHTAANTHSGQFSWGDCIGLSPHEIALQFIEHYPHIAKWGKGKDKEYKEWFKQACDLAQRGYIFYAFTDGKSCFGNNHKMLLSKEPETGEYLPFPPAGEIE